MTSILVVEDDPGIALGLEDDLRLEGYEVEVARDGETAARRAQEQNFDLIAKMEDTSLASETIDELLFKINQRNVIYAAPKLDITDAVLNRLNQGYSKEVIEK